MSHPRLVKTLFTSLLRSAKSLDVKVAWASLGSLPSTLLAPLFFPGVAATPTFPTLASLVAPAFSPTHRALPPGPPLDKALNACLSALSTLNTLNALPSHTLLTLMKGRPAGVTFLVGQVVRHVPTGHKGVVIGWAEECQASATFVAMNRIAKTDTPFYTVAIDTQCRPQCEVGLWAQGTLELCPPTSSSSATPLISHPLVDTLFEGVGQRGLVPGPKLSMLFPLDKLLMSASQQGGGVVGGDSTGGGAEGVPHQPQSVKTLG